MDPIQLLVACSFAAVFMFALGIEIGMKIGTRLGRLERKP
jgi:hypothetical protein